MPLIVDLHTHSHFSRATAKDSTVEGLYRWGKIKGIQIIGTGDFTHPGWLSEITKKLIPAEPGLFRLREDLERKINETLPASVKSNSIRFILTTEISNIYKKGGKVRKLHHLLAASGLEVVSLLNKKLSTIGNLEADGRPILGLDSKELLKICLETDRNILFIPAHIWTPWFSLFGSSSGFDSIAEAFDELAPEVHAVETGLSSDPHMNWRVEGLEKVTIISNSDAHSPTKLGREATVINSKLDYFDIAGGINTNDQRIAGTIEFFPEEGKYHHDGHRDCRVCCAPSESESYQGICPVCHKPLTIGVDHRVHKLAKYPPDYEPATHKQVEYIIPLIEIIAEVKGAGSASKAVDDLYKKVIAEFGNEFELLRNVPLDEIKGKFPELAQALGKMRKKEIYIEPGYDGVYGKIKVYGNEEERRQASGQMSLL